MHERQVNVRDLVHYVSNLAGIRRSTPRPLDCSPVRYLRESVLREICILHMTSSITHIQSPLSGRLDIAVYSPNTLPPPDRILWGGVNFASVAAMYSKSQRYSVRSPGQSHPSARSSPLILFIQDLTSVAGPTSAFKGVRIFVRYTYR